VEVKVKGSSMAEEPELVAGPTFDQEEMEMVACAVWNMAGSVYESWQEDVNDLELQFISEKYKKLVGKFLEYSQGLQEVVQDGMEKLEAMTPEQMAELERRAKKSDLSEILEKIEGEF
jgi:hypothetical protein